MHNPSTCNAGPFRVPADLEARVDELITHYPQRRSASLMVLHALQDHFGFVAGAAIEWTAAKLGLQPINLYELVTFYPMFRTEPAGRFQLKVCRTLSCALAGAAGLHRHLCERLGLDPTRGGLQTSPDGRFSVEFVECLASCDKAPVMMCNETFHEGVSAAQADQLLNALQSMK
jgi:NADH-quinone oxidoreductase subunit E